MPVFAYSVRMDINALISELFSAGRLREGARYARSDLQALFQSHGVDAEVAFRLLRQSAGEHAVAGRAIRVEGEKRGTRYIFGPRDAQAPACTIDVARAPAPIAPSRPIPETAMGEQTLDVYYGDNLELLRALPSESFQLIYIDPPFNTGKVQSRTQIQTVRDDDGDRTGFKGQRYSTIKIGTKGYLDKFDDFLEFLEPRIEEARRLLTPDGSFFLHLDYREVHYAKVLCDVIFGRDSFINEIIWAYDYGARATKRWSAKHDNILWYAKDRDNYIFDLDAADRIPYMAPGLVGEEKAAKGKTPTDTWWHTIVSPNGHEKTGYPTQKPLGIINRLVKVHTRTQARVLDFFAGSGTLGEAALAHGRSATLIDNNPEAIAVIHRRLAKFGPKLHGISLDSLPKASSEDADRIAREKEAISGQGALF